LFTVTVTVTVLVLVLVLQPRRGRGRGRGRGRAEVQVQSGNHLTTHRPVPVPVPGLGPENGLELLHNGKVRQGCLDLLEMELAIRTRTLIQQFIWHLWSTAL
jgi:hypothetical protein